MNDYFDQFNHEEEFKLMLHFTCVMDLRTSRLSVVFSVILKTVIKHTVGMRDIVVHI